MGFFKWLNGGGFVLVSCDVGGCLMDVVSPMLVDRGENGGEVVASPKIATWPFFPVILSSQSMDKNGQTELLLLRLVSGKIMVVVSSPEMKFSGGVNEREVKNEKVGKIYFWKLFLFLNWKISTSKNIAGIMLCYIGKLKS